jgi:hypothetical protein
MDGWKEGTNPKKAGHKYAPRLCLPVVFQWIEAC